MAFQILALSGGGYCGLYTACVLAEIESQTGRRAIDMFDMFAGTSIGGIIALGLAAEVSAADIRDAFLDNGARIFGSSPPGGSIVKFTEMLGGLFKTKYTVPPLERTIEQIVGTDTLMKDLRRPTIVTAVNLTKGGPKIFKTGHHPSLFLDWPLRIVDVALATSAAPTYFPTHKIGDELFADGGLFANSPDLISMHEAEQFMGVSADDIQVLSVGTTTSSFAFSAKTSRQMGIWSWVKNERLTNAIIGSQQAIANDMMRHRLDSRYVRIDRAQASNQRNELALDCASGAAKATLSAMAHASVAEAGGNSSLRSILAHQAIDRPFLNATLRN